MSTKTKIFLVVGALVVFLVGFLFIWWGAIPNYNHNWGNWVTTWYICFFIGWTLLAIARGKDFVWVGRFLGRTLIYFSAWNLYLPSDRYLSLGGYAHYNFGRYLASFLLLIGGFFILAVMARRQRRTP